MSLDADSGLTISEISARRKVSAALESVDDYFYRMFRVKMRRVQRFRIGHVQQVGIHLCKSETIATIIIRKLRRNGGESKTQCRSSLIINKMYDICY